MPEGHVSPDFDPPEISLFDASNPKSVLNLVSREISAAIQRIPARLLEMTEKELRSTVRPDATLCQLKIQFQLEYARCLEKSGTMKIANVIKGVCNKEFFYSTVVQDTAKLAWVVTPPVDSLIAMREILHLGLGELRKIMATPHVDHYVKRCEKTGIVLLESRKANPAVMGQKMKALTLLMDRVYGSVVQRAANVNVNVESKDPSHVATKTFDDLEAIDAEIRDEKSVLISKEES